MSADNGLPETDNFDLAERIAEAILADYAVGVFAEGSEDDERPGFYAADLSTLADIIRTAIAAEAPD